MITKRLKERVLDEAFKLNKHTTKEEKDRLEENRLNLDPNNNYNCIYGLLTGYCANERATELFNKCAFPYSKEVSKYKTTGSSKFSFSKKIYRSSIEYYIYHSDNHSNLIDCIVGNKEITIKDL